MLQNLRSQSYGYNGAVVQEDHLAYDQQGMAVLIVGEQFLGPSSFVFWGSCKDQRSEFGVDGACCSSCLQSCVGKHCWCLPDGCNKRKFFTGVLVKCSQCSHGGAYQEEFNIINPSLFF